MIIYFLQFEKLYFVTLQMYFQILNLQVLLEVFGGIQMINKILIPISQLAMYLASDTMIEYLSKHVIIFSYALDDKLILFILVDTLFHCFDLINFFISFNFLSNSF